MSYRIILMHRHTPYINQRDYDKYYINPLVSKGIYRESIITIPLPYPNNKPPKANDMQAYFNAFVHDALEFYSEDTELYLLIADAHYFKYFAGVKQADPYKGMVMPLRVSKEVMRDMIPPKHIHALLGTSINSLRYKPENEEDIYRSVETVSSCVSGNYSPPGEDIIHHAVYPSTISDISYCLNELKKYPKVTVDIETKGLDLLPNENSILTIAFAVDTHNGIAFPVDRLSDEVKEILCDFFESSNSRFIFHNATFDIRHIILSLFMRGNFSDKKAMHRGLRAFDGKVDDTKIIAYLATNTCTGNNLSLKELAQEFAGNYALDEINNASSIEESKLLEYNLVDTLATWFVYNKYYHQMVNDNQENIYKTLLLPSLMHIIEMELTGMPMCTSRIKEVKDILETSRDDYMNTINNHPLISNLNLLLQQDEMVKANAKLKTKQHPIEHFSHITFNPNSTHHLIKLLYDTLELPVLETTKSGNPSTRTGVIKNLVNHVDESNKETKELLEAIVEHRQIVKILSTFIPAFEKGITRNGGDSISWLHGNFNIGGTVSGRLSSNNPNLQNLPSGSKYGKLIKSIFQAPKGWIFAGADFNSLEDMINALTTKDPNKLKIYIDGFEGHSLRAAYYFKEELSHIDLHDPVSVNSIADTHPKLRQESKSPTFALTYQGTYSTLMKNLGWSEEKAKAVEANYHELYKQSTIYVNNKLLEASQRGYVEVAFGLRIRTPLIEQSVWNSPKVPQEALAEGRTAGNALGQSYGLLNNRAAVEFFQRVKKANYEYDIFPVSLIHDAIYILIRDDVKIVEWANRNLIECMQWQELPEIQHDQVKLGAELSLFYPSWAEEITIPNNASIETIKKICKSD